MSFVIRPSREDDLEHLYEMAKLTGGGFTNLPADRDALRGKLERSAKAFANTGDELVDETFLLVLENTETGAVRGTCQLMTQVGQQWPFYSYRLNTLTQYSQELDRTVRAEMLHLVTDLEGCSEVGGLFLHPNERAGGLGLLLARSRYLFIAMHRARFAERVLAELRGIIDDRGGSPFWDGVAGRFFGMTFQEADYFNAINGNQFIADLMPKYPVYVAMLDDDAREVIGLPHPTGRAAMRMLEKEGLRFEGYVDIFDGGPTMLARTDDVVSVADAKPLTLGSTALDKGERALIATGHLTDFRCSYGSRSIDGDTIAIDATGAATLQVGEGDTVWSVPK
ncbi:arginine N-succinyltransferase [Citromicrobium sp. RCC1885]|uniref:arginine N-succinyltransferase n=1 Tax=unclassified Citromicrobium TaxID=2630544 RepID=UPI0006C923B6|nr:MULTISPECIES: arginine N-succinyltransferase [unclassified Citromicrobium]KPM24693.1 arginine N-succinyltransferase [Citromicrobium sp. RCC1885]KPM27936.1 arginine N-succinyltransferase [Citromicrobium sp. RCC1878]MAY76705.1 arginine N-succinyltransferase [Citromicrobium sp.]OAM10561.1 arginine N-succinyltransferase [Citromicrobium sp. RCC1897]